MPLSINQIPIPVPSSTDPANFSARGDAVFGAFPDFITQTNAVASEAAANRDSAEASKTAAANSETNAATYASNATTSANNASSSSVAPLWVSGTTYAINDKRVSPITGQVYRRKTAGAGTTDPSLDSTNWYAVLLDADTQYPSIKPTLNLDFANSGKLDPRITFTRASTATYYDGKTFAKAEENLLTNSSTFSGWGTTNSTITLSAAVAPDGASTASLLTGSGTPGSHNIFLYASSKTGPVTISVHAKAGTNSYIQIFNSSDANFYANFDLSLGTVGSFGSNTSASIVSVGGGYYRCVISTSNTSNADRVFLSLVSSSSSVRSESNALATNLYIWGAQLEQRSSVTAYTPTTSQPITKYQPVLKTASNNEPRFDYDPVTLEARGLLIEEQRTNLLLRSQQFEAADWVRTYMTVLSDSIVAPDGSLAADFFVSDTSSNAKSTHQAVTVTSGVSYSLSVYAKAAGIDYVILRYQETNFPSVAIRFDLTSGMTSTVSGYTAPTSFGATYIGNGWYRLTITSTATGSGLGYPTISLSKDTTSYAYPGDGASGIYIWGAQLEQGSFATSYIPTTTTAVTRQADSASITGTNFTSWYNSQGGSVYMEADTFTTSSSFVCLFSINDGTTSNTIEANAGGANAYFQVKNSALQADLDLGNFQVNKFSKIAVKFAFNDFAACQDSGALQVDTSGTLPAVTRLDFGNAGSIFGNPKLNGHIRKFSYYPRVSQNYQLQILTK